MQEQQTRQAFRSPQARGFGNRDSADHRRLRATSAIPSAFRRLDSELERPGPGKLIWGSVLLTLGCFFLLLSGCRSRLDTASPSIEFTRVPPAEASRTDRLDIIQGRVTGARPGQQIVLYAKTGTWWIQPLSNPPFTKIRPDSTTCAEVTLTRSFGYGNYSFVVRDTSHLEPAVVLAMFTWDYAEGDQNNREMDIEISRWGDPASKNAQYEIQPFHVPANVARFTMPAGALAHSFRWEPGKVSFRTVRSSLTNPEIISEHVFTSGVPSPGAESVRLALYVYGKTDNLLQNDAEVVIEKFEYLP